MRAGDSSGTPDVRAHNLARALRLVAESGEPVSRARIADRAGLSRATAGSLVDELVAAGLVAETAPTRAGRAGRPATELRLEGRAASALGLELNVDYLAVVLVDLAGEVLSRRVSVEDSRGRPPAETLQRLGKLAASAVRDATGAGPLAGAVVAVPGLVGGGGGPPGAARPVGAAGPAGAAASPRGGPASAGVVRSAPNLGWDDVPAAALLARTPALRGVPLRLANEADAGALAELVRGGLDTDTFVRVSGEVGVGGSIVLAGATLAGSRGWGGELGHVVVDPDGPACPCGSTGCLEQYAGQEALLRAAGLPVPAATALSGEGLSPSLGVLSVRALDGDHAVLQALTSGGRALGIALAATLNLLDVGTAVLGGSCAVLAPWLAPALTAELGRRVQWARWEPPAVVVSMLGAEAAVLGAADGVRRDVLDDPAAHIGRISAR